MIRKLFATPIHHANLDDERLRLAAKRLILGWQSESHRHPDPPQGQHPGVFESRFDFLDTPCDETITALRTALLTHLQAFLAVVQETRPEQVGMAHIRSHSWFHITSAGGYFQPHNHPNASWSLVWCADNGHQSPCPEAEQSGCLVFSDPRATAAMHLDRFNRRQHRDVSFDGARYFLQNGDLLIFPSFVTHHVTPYRGRDKRITVAANFWADLEYG